MNEINWNDPNLDLDKITGFLDIEEEFSIENHLKKLIILF